MKKLRKKIIGNKYYMKIAHNSFWNNLFKNSFWAFSGDAIASVLGLIITILLIKLIGSEKYGIIVLAQTYMTIMDVVFNVQSWKSVIQYGQKSIVKDDIASLNGYIKLGSLLDISTAIFGGIVAILIAPIVGEIFNWSCELVVCAQIFSFTIFSHFAGTPTAVLRILNKFNLVAFQKFISALLKLVALALIFIIKNNVSIFEVTIVYCAVDIIGNLLLVVFAIHAYLKKYKKLNLIRSKMPSDTKEFVKFTIWGTLGETVDVPVNYLDVFIISLLGNELVAVFKVYKQCVAILQKVTSPIQQSILPQFSELAAKGEKQRGYDVVIKIRNAIIRIIGPIALVLGISSIIWLKFIYGEIYAQYWYILFFYLLIQVFALSYTTVHPYYLSLNKAKYSTIFVLVSNVAYVVIALLSVRIIGMWGLILAYLIQVFLVIYLKVRSIKRQELLNE